MTYKHGDTATLLQPAYAHSRPLLVAARVGKTGRDFLQMSGGVNEQRMITEAVMRGVI